MEERRGIGVKTGGEERCRYKTGVGEERCMCKTGVGDV